MQRQWTLELRVDRQFSEDEISLRKERSITGVGRDSLATRGLRRHAVITVMAVSLHYMYCLLLVASLNVCFGLAWFCIVFVKCSLVSRWKDFSRLLWPSGARSMVHGTMTWLQACMSNYDDRTWPYGCACDDHPLAYFSCTLIRSSFPRFTDDCWEVQKVWIWLCYIIPQHRSYPSYHFLGISMAIMSMRNVKLRLIT